MAVDWGDYVVYHAGVSAPVETIPRMAARIAFVKLMTDRPARIALLTELAARNGVPLEGPDGVDALDHWFRCEVREDPRQPGRLDPVWASVVGDISLFLGDLALAESPRLRWEFCVADRGSPAYHRAVLTGFRGRGRQDNADLDLDVTEYGLRILAGADAEHGHFARILQGLADHASGTT